jgi:hypothetical protein
MPLMMIIAKITESVAGFLANKLYLVLPTVVSMVRSHDDGKTTENLMSVLMYLLFSIYAVEPLSFPDGLLHDMAKIGMKNNMA